MNRPTYDHNEPSQSGLGWIREPQRERKWVDNYVDKCFSRKWNGWKNCKGGVDYGC